MRKLTAVVSMITTFSFEFELVTIGLLICVLLFELTVVDGLNALRLLRSLTFNSVDKDERRRVCSSFIVVAGMKLSDVRLQRIDVCCSN